MALALWLAWLGAAPLPARAQSALTTTTLVLPLPVQQQVDDLNGQAAAVEAEVERLDMELAQLVEQHNLVTETLAATNADLVKLRHQLAAAQKQRDRKQEGINKRVAAAYKAGDQGLLGVLLDTRGFSDFVRRVILLYKVTERDNLLVEELTTAGTEMVQVEQEIEENKRRTRELQRQLAEQRPLIEAKLAERKSVLNDLDVQVKAVIEQERQRQEEERRRLEAELRARLEAEQNTRTAAGARYAYIAPTSDALLNQVLETAATYLGIPYTWGGEKPSTGMDCSGFTLYVFRQHGVQLPHFAAYQQQMGVEVSREEARAGDLVFFGSYAYHVAMYIGNDQIIEAPRTGDVIKVTPLSNKKNISGFRRFPLQPRLGAPTYE